MYCTLLHGQHANSLATKAWWLSIVAAAEEVDCLLSDKKHRCANRNFIKFVQIRWVTGCCVLLFIEVWDTNLDENMMSWHFFGEVASQLIGPLGIDFSDSKEVKTSAELKKPVWGSSESNLIKMQPEMISSHHVKCQLIFFFQLRYSQKLLTKISATLKCVFSRNSRQKTSIPSGFSCL